MNETDKKIIEELLDRQAERLEKRMIHVFNEGFEQVVLPHIARIDGRLDKLESGQERIERKVNAVVERQDEQGLEIQKIKKFVNMPEAA